MRIYVAGPMRGIKDHPERFRKATAQLRDLGHEVFSPDEQPKHPWSPNPTPAIREVFKGDMTWICDKADAIALLPGWNKSKGAKAEAALGKALGIRVDLIETFIGKKHDTKTRQNRRFSTNTK